MLDSLPPGAPSSTVVVSQKVLINGTVLSTAVLLSRIIVNKTFNKIAYAKIIFLDGSASDADFALSDDDTYKPGNQVEIQLGYSGNTDTVFKGIIVKHAIKVRESGDSLLIIEAKDLAIKLNANRNSAYFINQKDSDVITSLAGSLDTSGVTATTVTHPQLVQFDTTNWDFIVTRAEANSMLVLTDDGKLIVTEPSTSGAPVLTATYGTDIYEFEAEMDVRRQIAGVSSISWDYTQQQLEKSDAGSATFSDNGNIALSDLDNVVGAQVLLNHPGHLSQPQLQNWSDAYALRNYLSKNVGRVRIQGNASIKPGVMITLAGVGDRFNGNVFVTGVMHVYEGTWLTDVQFGWNEELFYKKEGIMDKPTAGLLAGVNGLLIGTVLSTDDSDAGQYRVQVQIPTITSGNDGVWARVATLDAGANRGSYFRPQATDEVVLGFLNDDPREPIILGYLHSSSSKQPPFPVSSSTQQFGFLTKNGVQIMLDDTNKSLVLSVKTAAGQKSITINDSSGAMVLADENNNTIKMDTSGITIQAGPKGNVIIKGLKVMIN
jgi:Rhs element Vgr protein